MVDGERDLVADHGTDLGDILLEEGEALLGEVQSGERVADIVGVVAAVALAAVVQRLHLHAFGVRAEVVEAPPPRR